MSATPTRARPQGQAAKAARAEKQPKAKQIEFRDLTLDLPAELPSTFLFDIIQIDANDVMSLGRLLLSIVGSDQFTGVRNTLGPKDNAAEVMFELLDAVFAQYGLALGESPASQDS